MMENDKMSSSLPIPIPEDFFPLLDMYWSDDKEVNNARGKNDARLLQLPLYQSTSFSPDNILSLIDGTGTVEERLRLEKEARRELVRRDLYAKLGRLLQEHRTQPGGED